MTAEPASTRANRINSDSLDWSYIAISLMVGHSTGGWRARGRSTADTPSAPTRWPALRQPGRVPLRGPREGLRVDILPDLRQLAISNGKVADPIVFARLIRGFA